MKGASLRIVAGALAFVLSLFLLANAQETRTIPRVGLLAGAASPSSPDAFPSRSSPHYALLDGLRELGWVDGKNIFIIAKYAEGRLDRLPSLARELVQMNVDVIVSMGGPALGPAAAATRTIPIVMISGSADPVADGFAANLARPGGNRLPSGLLLLRGAKVADLPIEQLNQIRHCNKPANGPSTWAHRARIAHGECRSLDPE
jgi:ABC transporter substrate binding protein